MPATEAIYLPAAAPWKRYLELTKPRIVALMLFTALVGMAVSLEGGVPWDRILLGTLGIGLAASGGAVLNHLLDRRIDALMERTRDRPLPSGQVDGRAALVFAALLTGASMIILAAWVNPFAALITFAAVIGYGVIYTLLLKRTTPQNIVWGGAAGASPPLLGSAAVAGEVTLDAALLFLIIFIWTPPHFWPLAIHRLDDYRQAHIPMLPVTHGVAFTKIQILLYSIMLMAVSLLPFASRSAGLLYLAGAVPLGLVFIGYAWRLLHARGREYAMATFRFSILYLFGLFALMITDHIVRL